MFLWALENFLKQHAQLASCAHELAECYLLQAICVCGTPVTCISYTVATPVTQHLMVGRLVTNWK